MPKRKGEVCAVHETSSEITRFDLNDLKNKPVLIWDGECGFCARWIARWKRWTSDRVVYAPYQQVAQQFPQISREEFKRAAQLVMPSPGLRPPSPPGRGEREGEVYSGAHAMLKALAYAPGKRWLLWMYEYVPGFRFVAEAFYRWVAANRSRL